MNYEINTDIWLKYIPVYMLLKHDITERLFYEHPDVYKGFFDADQINFKFVDKILDMVIMFDEETNYECSLHEVIKFTEREVNLLNVAFRNWLDKRSRENTLERIREEQLTNDSSLEE